MKKINTFGKDSIKKYAVGAALGLSLLLPLLAMTAGAAVLPQNPPPIIESPQAIINLIAGITRWLSVLVLVVALLMFFYAAILYITAGASETALAKSKTVLIYAVVGTVVALLAFSFIPLIKGFLNLTG